MPKITRSRAQFLCAFIKHIWPRPRRHHIHHIDAHLARDIGVTPAELARAQIAFPSQQPHPPRW